MAGVTSITVSLLQLRTCNLVLDEQEFDMPYGRKPYLAWLALPTVLQKRYSAGSVRMGLYLVNIFWLNRKPDMSHQRNLFAWLDLPTLLQRHDDSYCGNAPVSAFWMDGNLTCVIEETSAVMPTDVLGSTGAGRIALEGLVAISPQGPCLILGGPVAGHAAGGLLVRVEMGF